jgi:hypothetical protein
MGFPRYGSGTDLYGAAHRRHNPGNNQHGNLRRPARSKARAQVSTVEPEVSTSPISMSRRPARLTFCSAVMRKAPCTFSARADLESPTG